MTIYEDAQRRVEQWEKHDKFRCCDSDRVLWSNGCEPDEVAMAREVIRLTDAALTREQLSAIGKAASACRFVAAYGEQSKAAKQELYDIATVLKEIETKAIGNERSDS